MRPMKKIFLILSLALLVAEAGAAVPPPDLIAQIHFAGAQKIFANAGATNFTDEFCGSEALALRAQTADKLAPWLAGWWEQSNRVKVVNGASRLRPLLDDLQKAEWFLEARKTPGGQAQWSLAIKLAADRARLWQTNLKPFFKSAIFETANGWLFFESASAAPKLGARLAQEIDHTQNAWLSADINWPQLGAWNPQLKELGLPEMKFQVRPSNADLRIDGKCFFPENLNLVMDPWQFPTNLVHQPFVSFTAARGFSHWLQSQSWAKPYNLAASPNQAFVWALQKIAYQTFAAVPVPDADASVKQLFQRWSPLFNTPEKATNFIMPMTLVKTNAAINLRGAPFISPFVQAISRAEGQFLFAGAFPNTPRSEPLPKELFQRLAQKNLLFYHWEITAERLPEALNLSQLALLLTKHRQLGSKSAALNWIMRVAPRLGNTVTEITQTGPAELTFSRAAPGGLTAVEFLVLGNWLSAPNFPQCDLRLPERPKLSHRAKPASPAMPAPAPAK